MDLDEIKNFISDPAVFDRGKWVFESGAVVSFTRTGDRVKASVQGSRDEPYRIEIRSGTPRPSASCDCPAAEYGGPCKHIAAVFLKEFHDRLAETHPSNWTLFQNKPRSSKHAKELSPVVRDRKNFREPEHEPSQTIPLPSSPGEGRFRTGVSLNKDLADRTRLVFVLEEDKDFRFGATYAARAWSIRPGLQILKKTGEPGRLLKFDEGHLSEKPSARSVQLLEALRQCQKNSCSFSVLASLVDDTTPLFWADRADEPLKIRDIKSVSFRFLPRSEGQDLVFVCSAGITAADDKVDFRFDSDSDPVTLSPMVSCLITRGFLLRSLGDPLLFRLFSDVRNPYARGISADTIASLAEIVRESGRKDLEIRRTIPKRSTLYPVPSAILEISRINAVRVRLDPVFLYDSVEVEFGDNRQKIMEIRKDEIVQIVRDGPYEWAVRNFVSDLVRSAGVSVESWNSFAIDADMSVVRFLIDHGKEILSSGVRLRMKGTRSDISGAGGDVSLKVSSGVDWFGVTAVYSEKDREAAEVSVDSGLLAHGLVKAGDSFVFLRQEDIELLQKLSENGGSELKIAKADISALAAIRSKVLNPDEPGLVKAKEIVEKLSGFKGVRHVAVPASFKAELRDYQHAGLDWLVFLHEYGLHGCLADDMGLGKTVQALALLDSLKGKKEFRTSVIVTPVSTLGTWEKEILRFAPGLKHLVHAGPERTKILKKLRDFDIVLLSYHILKNDIELLQKLKPYYLILDESQAIKNRTTEIFKAVRSIEPEFKLSLTGTPVENNTLELWAQMDFLNPGLLGTSQNFQKKFGRLDEGNAGTAAADLRRTVSPFILRRKKEDVLKDLPGKQEMVLYSEMEPPQAAIYEANRKVLSERLEAKIEKDGFEKSAMDVLTALLRLRQIALFPELADPRFKDKGSSKFEQFKEFTSEVLSEGHKILVFSQFTGLLDILKSHFDSEDMKYSYLDGSMSMEDRQSEIDKFQEKGETDIFLLSLKAGGKGLTLTRADYVILFDPWWNPAVEMQAIDRCCRIGQTKKVFAYRLIVKGTVEEKMLELQEKKKRLVDDLISAEQGIFKKLKKEDILNLFS